MTEDEKFSIYLAGFKRGWGNTQISEAALVEMARQFYNEENLKSRVEHDDDRERIEGAV